MATTNNQPRELIGTKSPKLFSKIRTTIETAYYRNNVVKVDSLNQAYKLAIESPGTIITDLPVFNAEKLGLPNDAKVLIFNDGIITGRNALVRRLINTKNENKYSNKLRDAVFNSRKKTMYHATAYVGLHEDFMVKAHLLVPKGYENTLYNWLLNFQPLTNKTNKTYENSFKFEDGDIYLYSDPDEFIEGYENGISIFDSEQNVGALLGLRYFGEHKKATLTMAWTIASRNNYTACHGGQKRFNLENDKTYIAGVFGLSGSGKSTITHSKHKGKFDVTVLHDDAFVISNSDGSSVALEPSYFDKVQDYPTSSDDNKFLLSIQNVGATTDNNGLVVPVTEDIRNGNGRAIKSIFWTKNRVNKFNNKVDSIFWIMKDNSLPPIVKIESSILASALGSTLATKRTTAEYGADPNKLVFEPYANPFRLYPLRNDYIKFKDLFENRDVDCYILNTGSFLDNDIKKDITLGLIEDIVSNNIEFSSIANVNDIKFTNIPNFNPDFNNEKYKALFKQRMQSRIDYINSLHGHDILPEEAGLSILKVINDIL